MSVSPNLESALLKIARAKHHIDDLNRLIHALTKEHWSIVVTEETETGKRTLFFKADKPKPPELGLLIGDIAHNLRSALDNLVWALVSPHNPPNPDRVQFPFSANAQGLEAALGDRQIHLAGPEVVEKFRKIRPYKGGDDKLYSLHKLSIGDKHRAIATITSVAAISRFDIQKIDPAAPPDKFYDNFGAIGFENKSFYWWLPVDQADRRVFNGNTNVPASFRILFGDSEPFASVEVIPALHDLLLRVNEIVNRFRPV
jgi:hypothetical protein